MAAEATQSQNMKMTWPNNKSMGAFPQLRPARGEASAPRNRALALPATRFPRRSTPALFPFKTDCTAPYHGREVEKSCHNRATNYPLVGVGLRSPMLAANRLIPRACRSPWFPCNLTLISPHFRPLPKTHPTPSLPLVDLPRVRCRLAAEMQTRPGLRAIHKCVDFLT